MSRTIAAQSQISFKDLATAMIDRGVLVIPLKEKSKDPCTEHAAKDATDNIFTVMDWHEQRPHSNLGCVATPDTVGFIEDDSGEVKSLYEKETGLNFPDTFTVCSSGIKRHYYFKQTDATRRMGNLPQNKLFSARFRNQYVVGAGSIHPLTGLPYVIVNDVPIAPAPDEFVAWLIKKHGELTGKEKNGLVISGYRLPEKKLLEHEGRNVELTSYIGHICGLNPRLTLDAVMALAEKHTNKYHEPPLDTEEVERTAASIWKAEQRKPKQCLGAAAVKVEEEIVEPVEPPLAEFPVLPGSIHEFATNLDPDVPYAFKAISAIVRIGLALSNFVHLAGAPNIQPRLFAAMVANAGRGKTAANEQTGDHLNPLTQATVLSSMDSGPNLVATFKTIELDNRMKGIDAPPKLLLDPDELKDLFEKAKESKDSRNSLFGELLKLFENNRTANCTKKDGNIIVENAHLAMIGGATPSGYERMWVKTGGSQDGLMSRFVVIGSDAGELPSTRRPTNLDALNAAVNRISEQVSNAAQSKPVITIIPKAAQLLEEWWTGIKADDHAIRLTDIVKRFLMVLAITNDTTTVDTDLMAIGIEFGKHVLSARYRYNPDDSASYVQAFENRIIAAFKKHSLMSKRQCMRCINPARYDGGYDIFDRAWSALTRVGKLIQRGRIGKRQTFSLDDYER